MSRNNLEQFEEEPIEQLSHRFSIPRTLARSEQVKVGGRVHLTIDEAIYTVPLRAWEAQPSSLSLTSLDGTQTVRITAITWADGYTPKILTYQLA